jgi:hypothetical protein
MKSEFLANVCWVLHMLFVAWVVITPFTNNEPLLVLHLFVIPFLWFHWWMWDDTCALTLLERGLRGVPSDQSFFHNLVSPVYKIQDAHIRSMSWLLTVVLWLVTLHKVLKKPGMIKDVMTGGRPESRQKNVATKS